MEQTIRQKLIELLQVEEMTARDLSQALSIMEKEVYRHLEHVERTVLRKGLTLHITPCKCQDCRYSFSERTRITKPGKCPRCRKSHIAPPRFSIR
ncbi:MAG: transcriptional regulator [Deltaproteobacteria bacterium]